MKKELVIESITKNVFGGQMNNSIEHLIDSAIMTNGLYSFNRLK